MAIALLETKLPIPPTRTDLMPRSRLVECLKAGFDRKLTVYEFNEPALAFYHSLGSETSSRRMSRRLE